MTTSGTRAALPRSPAAGLASGGRPVSDTTPHTAASPTSPHPGYGPARRARSPRRPSTSNAAAAPNTADGEGVARESRRWRGRAAHRGWRARAARTTARLRGTRARPEGGRASPWWRAARPTVSARHADSAAAANTSPKWLGWCSPTTSRGRYREQRPEACERQWGADLGGTAGTGLRTARHQTGDSHAALIAVSRITGPPAVRDLRPQSRVLSRTEVSPQPPSFAVDVRPCVRVTPLSCSGRVRRDGYRGSAPAAPPAPRPRLRRARAPARHGRACGHELRAILLCPHRCARNRYRAA